MVEWVPQRQPATLHCPFDARRLAPSLIVGRCHCEWVTIQTYSNF
jgi:hypothetical protein